MLRRLGIRGKVLAALSVPVLVLFLLAGVLSLDSVRQAQTSRTVATLLGSLQESRELVTVLQAERRAALQLGSGENVSADYESAKEATADALSAFNTELTRVDLDTLDPEIRDAVADLRRRVNDLTAVRARLISNTASLPTVGNDYTRVIEDVVAFTQDVADALDDRRLAQIIGAHTQVTDMVENYREEQAFGRQVLLGEREAEEVNHLANLFPSSDLQHERTQAAVLDLELDDVEVPPLGVSFRDFVSFNIFRDLIATRDTEQFSELEADEFVQRAGEEIDAMEPVQTDLRVAAQQRATATAAQALRNAGITIAVSLAAGVLSIIAALAIARQIINPLRRLTEAAGTVRDELPRLVDQVAIPGQGPDLRLTQIPVESRDEVGQLATAFNEVNSTTIQVAQEQAALRGSIAEMFVNVARRDQVLLNRQLSFIDALERSEEDPKTLADLFRLDHLATRMRRNAESLLVLAGIDTGRRLREALPTSDVIRTASSEIEHYERVQLDLPIDPQMLGHTALPAAHMLAELLENATVFSEPGTPVQVSTGVDDEHVIITILDQGLGMTPEELADANTKIATTSAGDVLGSQRLGLFVVGRIASRLGAKVELGLGPQGKGTLVTVRLPQILFIGADKLPRVEPTAPAVVHEEFVLPEQAAEVVHGAAYAPAPVEVGDVAPGALGSAENPATEVDIEALVDGTTGLGLPRRRTRTADAATPAPSGYDRDSDDAAAAPSIPLAPQAADLAGVSQLADDEVWTPPVVEQSAPLTVRRPAEPSDAAQSSGLPVREPAASALPTRTPSATTGSLPVRQPAAAAAAAAAPTTPPTEPAAVPERAAVFSSFRSRRAELAAAAVHSGPEQVADPESAPVDGAERLAAAAAFFGRSAVPATAGEESPDEADEPMVIPTLVEDEDEYGDPVFAPGAPAYVVEPSPSVHEALESDDWVDAAAVPATAEHAPWAEQPAEPVAADPVAAAEPFAPAEPVAVTTPAAGTYLGRHALPPVEDVPEGDDWEPLPSTGAHVWTPDEGEAEAESWAAEADDAVGVADEEPATWSVPTWGPVSTDDTEIIADAADVADVSGPGDDWTAQETWPAPAAEEPEPAVSEASPWLPVASEPVATQPVAPVAAASDDATGAGKPKRRWFGLRKARPEPPAVVTHEPAAPVVPDVPSGFVPVSGPVRQSAWGSTDGAHTAPDADVPEAVEPQPVAEVPSWSAPAFEPEPVADPVVAAEHAPAMPDFRSEIPAPNRPWEERVPSAEAAAPTTAWQPPEVTIPAAAVEPEATWSPTPAWSPEPAAEAPAPALPTRSEFTPQTTFTPEPLGGPFDDEVTNMLAQKADIAQQALAELSQLSSYRPKAVSGTASAPLVRRTPANIPAAPAIEQRKDGQRTERDADQVRSLLSNFQSGTARGRQAGTPDTQDSGQGTRPAGSEDGPDVGHGEPVTTPDTDLSQRSTTW